MSFTENVGRRLKNAYELWGWNALINRINFMGPIEEVRPAQTGMKS
jgi:hypothetical protein